MEKKDTYVGLIVRQDSLIRRYWVEPIFDENDNIKKEGYYAEKDVTDQLPMFLSEVCIIENGTTLRDLFKILNHYKDLLSIIQRRNWFEDWLTAGLNSPISDLSKVRDYSDLEFDYLELSKCIDRTIAHTFKKDDYLVMSIVDDSINNVKCKVKTKVRSAGEKIEDTISMSSCFTGKSYPVTKKYIEKNPYCHLKVGDIENIGFLGSHIAEYIDCPLKIKNTININKTEYDDDDNMINSNDESIKSAEYAIFTLFEIIDCIFWELSFHGSPDDTKNVSNEIFDSVKKIKESNNKKDS